MFLCGCATSAGYALFPLLYQINNLLYSIVINYLIYMTKNKKKTAGQHIYETQKEHEASSPIEAGEFMEEIGAKEIMKKLRQMIEEREGLIQWQEKYYIVTFFKKNQQLHRIFEFYAHARHTRPAPEPGLTLYSWNPKTKEFMLEWTLPARNAFNTFLKAEGYADQFLIDCIKAYKKGKLK